MKNQRQRLARGIQGLWKRTGGTLEWAWICGRGVQRSFCTVHKGGHQGVQAESSVITSALCRGDSAVEARVERHSCSWRWQEGAQECRQGAGWQEMAQGCRQGAGWLGLTWGGGKGGIWREVRGDLGKG